MRLLARSLGWIEISWLRTKISVRFQFSRDSTGLITLKIVELNHFSGTRVFALTSLPIRTLNRSSWSSFHVDELPITSLSGTFRLGVLGAVFWRLACFRAVTMATCQMCFLQRLAFSCELYLMIRILSTTRNDCIVKTRAFRCDVVQHRTWGDSAAMSTISYGGNWGCATATGLRYTHKNAWHHT